MRIFVDTNILLDVLRSRRPFAEHSSSIWSLAESNRVEAFVSAVSFNNAYYVLCRIADKKTAYEAMGIVRDIFRVVPLDERILNKAIGNKLKDFEDAIQFSSAIHVHADYLLTRNVGDFPRRDVPVLSPESFLALGLSFDEEVGCD